MLQPTHFKYGYLDENNTLLVIISISLLMDQEKALLEMLETYKKAIGWTIANIKGNSLVVYQHNI